MSEPSLDSLELEHAALRRGLPRPAAAAIGAMVARAGLEPGRRAEVLEELVAHFEDGLAAGRTMPELLAEFGAADLRPPPPPLPTPPFSRGAAPMSHVLRDLRHAARRLLASPGFTAVAVLSLALGIGATTSVWSLVNAVIFRRSPIRAVGEVVSVYESSPNFHYNAFSYPDFKDFERGTGRVFSEYAAARYAFVQLSRGGTPFRTTAELVTGGYFPLLGIRPERGRLLGPGDDVSPGGHPVAVLSDGFWRRAFGGDTAVVGREVQLNGHAYTIVGVAPPEYPGHFRGIPTDLFAPMMMVNQLNPGLGDGLTERGQHGIFVMARLRAGMTVAAVRTAADGVARELRQTAPSYWRGDDSFLAIPTREIILYPPVDKVLYPVAGLLFFAVGLVLLVVCANLASFLLARAVDRRREIAMRLALGATRGRLVSQLLGESLLLGLVGGAGGLVVALGFARLLTRANLPLPLPVALDLRLDVRALVFTIAVSVMAGVLFGLAPALRASNPHLATTLRDDSAGGGGRGRLALRHGLLVAQVALSLVLMVGAGLFLRSLGSVRNVDPGFSQAPAALSMVLFPPAKYPEGRVLQAQRELAERFRRLPGVTAVAMISNFPLNLLDTEDDEVATPGRETPPGQHGLDADRAVVDTGFFAAAGIPVLRGRGFTTTDADSAPRVTVVNQRLAQLLWPGEEAIGKQMLMGDKSYEVVGLVATTKVRSLGEDPRPCFYLPLAQHRTSGLWYLVRTSGDDAATALAALKATQQMDPELISAEVRTLDRHLAVVRLPIQLGAMVIGGLALLAVVLAAIGLSGTVRYAVAQRTREVGIRLALGADAGAMVRLLMGNGLRLVAWGSAAGLAGALLLARLVSRLLFGVKPIDPVTFVAVPLFLGGVALVAAWLPARRAARVTPTEALRSEG